MSLLADLRHAAAERGLIAPDAQLNADTVFRLVRDMPYRRASNRDPATTVAEWRGTCSGKHDLLRAAFEELGVPVVLLVAPHEFTPESAPWLPEPLLEECRAAPVPDVHNFLRVQLEPHLDWQSVDATWPLAARELGLPVNEALRPGEDHQLAADPIEVHHVPPEVDALELKQRIIEDVAAGQEQRRDAFIEALAAWLDEALAERGGATSDARGEGTA
jgi:hypothetical protein